MSLRFEFLADYQDALPTVARWYFEEWGYLKKGETPEMVGERIRRIYLNSDRIPLILVGLENGKVLGAAQLKFREMDIYPDKEHWLGGVFTHPDYRGREVAEGVVNEAIRVASQMGVETLYLQTQDLTGGLYKRLGWKPIEQVNYDGQEALVMERAV